MTELELHLKNAEENQKTANETLRHLLENTKKAIETGHIGQAAQLFEETNLYCDKQQIPKQTIAPLGYAILLLRACEETTHPPEPTPTSLKNNEKKD